MCFGCMEKNKKPLRWGCEGLRPIVDIMPKSNGKQAPPLSFAVTPTVARDARPSPPSPYRKKSRFAKKKSAPPKKNTPAALLNLDFIKLPPARKPAIGGSVVARIPKWGHTWHETNKKSRYGGDVRADALSWV